MTIGTSIGLAFESDFHHEAGIANPPETADDNEYGTEGIKHDDTPIPARLEIKPVTMGVHHL